MASHPEHDTPASGPEGSQAWGSSSRDVITLREATKAWFAISLQTFGGPAGQIAVMQRTLVEEKRWIGQTASPFRTVLLHPAARSRGPTAGDLRWLAP